MGVWASHGEALGRNQPAEKAQGEECQVNSGPIPIMCVKLGYLGVWERADTVLESIWGWHLKGGANGPSLKEMDGYRQAIYLQSNMEGIS